MEAKREIEQERERESRKREKEKERAWKYIADTMNERKGVGVLPVFKSPGSLPVALFGFDKETETRRGERSRAI